MANSLENSYSDPRFGVVQQQTLPDTGANQTSVIAAAVDIRRHTFMKAVTVVDWNAVYVVGATQTGANTKVVIGKSAAGTGAVSAIGTALIGTQADNSVQDAALTGNTDFDAGDDIVLQYGAGTGLPASGFRVGANIAFVERFV